MTMFAAFAALAVVVPAAPAAAQGADQDLRCMLLSNVFSKIEKDPGRKQVAAAAFLFYFGRVDARLSGAALRTQIGVQGKALTNQNAGQLMTACAQRFAGRRQALQALAAPMPAPQPKK